MASPHDTNKLNLHVWVDHYLQSKNSTSLRAAMLVQLRREVTAGCLQIRRLTLADSGVAAFERKGSSALDVNDKHGISASPLERLVNAGEVDAVRVLLQRLDLNLGTCLTVDMQPEIQALLQAANERNTEFARKANNLRK
jgi:hypothetical protein